MKKPSFTIGIEEEYMLVDRESRNLIREAPASMLRECEALLQGQVAPEFLQCQIEVGTRVCNTLGEARDDLTRLRKTVAGVAGEYGFAMIAASTHPFSQWAEQRHTEKPRYRILARDNQHHQYRREWKSCVAESLLALYGSLSMRLGVRQDRFSRLVQPFGQ